MAQNILIDMNVMLSFNHTPAINYLLRAIYSRGSHRLRYIFAAVHNIVICIYKYARGPWNGLRCRNGFLEANWCTVPLANPGSNLAIRTRHRPLRGHHLSRYDGTTQNTCHDQIFFLLFSFIHDQWCGAHSTLVVSDISSPSTYRALICIRKNAIKFFILYTRVTN